MGWFSRRKGGSEVLPDRTAELLGRHMDAEFTAFPMAERAATRETVTEIGERCGIAYPPEFIAHVTGRFPGIYVVAREDVWPRPRPLEVGAFWTFLYGIHSFSPVAASEDWMRLDVAAERFRDETGLDAAPVLKIIGDANVFCTSAGGQLQEFDHELNTLAPVDLDFWGLLDRELAALAARKKRRVALDAVAQETR
jgi:hypothetical protein